ncbi:MAG: DPP IV N-terminal domain-containing protein [Myxococcales bacterium]|nr:DPP IV N-terminal domain-containing protein [Myxococcales bacterium]
MNQPHRPLMRHFSGLPVAKPLGLTRKILVGLLFMGLMGLGACGGQRSQQVCPAPPKAQPEAPRAAQPVVADAGFLAQYAATFRFRLGHPRSFAWLPGGEAVLYLRSPSRSFVQKLYRFNLLTGKETLELTGDALLAGAAETLSAEEKARRERQRQAARGITSFRLAKDGHTLLIPLSGRIFLWDLTAPKGKKARELKLGGKGAVLDPRLSPNGKHVAWVQGGTLWTQPISSSSEQASTKRLAAKRLAAKRLAAKRLAAKRLSANGTKNISFGLAEFVAQEEMGRHRGYWWSPDSKQLVYQQVDTTDVERMHIHDPLHPEKPGRSWPYPRPGKRNAKVRLGVVPVGGGATRWLDWDRATYPYLTQVRWQKGAPLTIVVQNRTQTELTVLRQPPKPGKWQPLLTERDKAWLNLDAQMPFWLPKGKGFLWTTERGGAWQLELRGAEGKLIRALTTPDFGYRRMLNFDPATDTLVLAASAEPSQRHIYRLAMKAGSTPKALTTLPGWHNAVVAKRQRTTSKKAQPALPMLLQLSPAKGPKRTQIHGNKKLVIPSEAEKPGFPLQPRFMTVGPKKVRAMVILPRNATAGRKLPVIMHVYGGPHYNVVRAAQGRYALHQWLADHGFVVCSFDGRGTPWRGRAWERVTKGDLLSAPLSDQVEALQALAKQVPEMDLQRVGVFGWSFGGTFSAAAVMKYPNVFKAAVAGAPVTDWFDYDTHYTERYLGVPTGKSSDKPSTTNQAYTISSPLGFAAKLKRPLMLIHGSADDNVWFSHSVKLSKALFERGISHEFVPLPGHTHMVRDAQTLQRMYARVIAFFRSKL